MPEPFLIESPALDELDQETFSGRGCLEHGIVVLRDVDSWNARERGYLELPAKEGMRRVSVAHDERGGPYALAPDGTEDTTLLISLTDDENHIACAWARVADDAPLMGVGIDLVAPRDFDRQVGTRHRKSLSELLFTEHERELAPQLDCPSANLAYATLFGAKEAAFKATAAPLRRWYDTHDEALLFEVRHFVMDEPGRELGVGRNGAAQVAMDRMGIDRVALQYATINDMALVTAVTLARSHRKEAHE